ncbi:hypothetical protein PG984_005593 [Apiospora sp. TS-2023a]
MVFRTARSLVEKHCPQPDAQQIAWTLGQVATKTPSSILGPAINASNTLANGFKKVPVLGQTDFTGLPVIGPIVVGVQLALAARAALGTAEHVLEAAFDPIAEGVASGTDAMRRDAEAMGAAALSGPEAVRREAAAMMTAGISGPPAMPLDATAITTAGLSGPKETPLDVKSMKTTAALSGSETMPFDATAIKTAGLSGAQTGAGIMGMGQGAGIAQGIGMSQGKRATGWENIKQPIEASLQASVPKLRRMPLAGMF